MARGKVAPPVTPRIVHAQPGQRLLKYSLLLIAVALVAWFSYERGKLQAPAGGGITVAESRQAAERIEDLEKERDALKRQVAELEQSVEQVNEALAGAQARIHSLQGAQSAPPAAVVESTSASVSEPEPEPEPVIAAAPAAVVEDDGSTADHALKLENVHIVGTDSADLYRLGFSVMHEGDSGGRVAGTIWIAVNGLTNGQPTRLSLKTLSPERRAFVKMGFDLQQDVVQDVVLPDDFSPRNILIEAKPYGDRYTGTAETFAWVTRD